MEPEEDYREEDLKWHAILGEWEKVEELYESYPVLCTIDIAMNQDRGTTLEKKRNRGTALHLAVSDNNEKVVRNLVDSIIRHNKKEALKCKNEKGETPLHLAASRGFKDICECIIGQNGERKYLIDIGNNDGESPLFLAALFWRKPTFLYLFDLKLGWIHENGGSYCSYTFEGLTRNDGDSILHCAIRKEYFDLALIMVDKCAGLLSIVNKDGFGPLKLLATRRSAFKSGSKMTEWQKNLYDRIPVGILNVEEAVKCYGMKQSDQSSQSIHSENYDTHLSFSNLAYMWRRDKNERVEEVRIMKQKHTWSGQLLTILMNRPIELLKDDRIHKKNDASETNLDEKNKIVPKLAQDNNTGDLKIYETLISETPILTAARNGIIEIVNALITKSPHSIYDVNSENKNVLLVAVENRRSNVVEALRKRFGKSNKMEIFDDLIQGVDKDENTVLHLVASSDQEWHITNPALKMMWHCKWFTHTKGLLPKDYTVRTNKLDKTAGELFKQKYASQIREAGAWFKETSESCSVVAALLSGVSFALSSNIPGGNNSETGKPTLQGRPAFDAYALSSIIGLCCSLFALILFLSIPISRKEPRDLIFDLPRKLLSGLSFLFLSNVAMFTAFCFGNYFVLDHKYKYIVFFIYAYTCIPAYLYVESYFQLQFDILRSIITIVPETGDKR